MQSWLNMTAADSMKTISLTASCGEWRTVPISQIVTGLMQTKCIKASNKISAVTTAEKVRRYAGVLLKTTLESDPDPVSNTSCST